MIRQAYAAASPLFACFLVGLAVGLIFTFALLSAQP